MKSIATVLHGMTTSDSPHSESTPDPFELQAILPTQFAQGDLNRLRERIAQLPQDADEAMRHRADVALRHAERTLSRALVRDAVQQTRPEGCWCLGAGGKERRYMPVLEGDPLEVLSEYCQCPEGVARRAQDNVNRDYYRATNHEHRTKELFRNAGVPARFESATFETYPISATTREAVATIREWVTGGAESLLIYGTFGTGKTGLAVAAMRQRLELAHVDTLFLTAPSLLDRIRQTYTPRRQGGDEQPDEADIVDAVRNAGLLVLDDLGAERPTDWVQEKLFTVINHRHDAMAPTIFTSNLDPEGLARHLGERIAWRIIEMSLVVKLDGPNLRDRR